MDLSLLDVFAERRYAGNQLAVVRGAGDLDTVTMQAIARETNFSETTFVVEPEAAQRERPDRARVRIFTPTFELPFAGHPTLGTAWALTGGAGSVVLELDAGDVPVSHEGGLGWMAPPPVELKAACDPEQAAALLGLPESTLDPQAPPRFARVGPEFLLIGLRDADALAALTIDATAFAGLRDRVGEDLGIFVFCATPGAATDYSARMLFESAGLREDPATGSANTAFAAFLLDLGIDRQGVSVAQGVQMGRPSRIELELRPQIRVGGRTQLVATGALAP